MQLSCTSLQTLKKNLPLKKMNQLSKRKHLHIQFIHQQEKLCILSFMWHVRNHLKLKRQITQNVLPNFFKKMNAICNPNEHQKLCIFLFRECFFCSRANKSNSSFDDGILSTRVGSINKFSETMIMIMIMINFFQP